MIPTRGCASTTINRIRGTSSIKQAAKDEEARLNRDEREPSTFDLKGANGCKRGSPTCGPLSQLLDPKKACTSYLRLSKRQRSHVQAGLLFLVPCSPRENHLETICFIFLE
jgi:hypothetical protein